MGRFAAKELEVTVFTRNLLSAYDKAVRGVARVIEDRCIEAIRKAGIPPLDSKLMLVCLCREEIDPAVKREIANT